MQSQSKWAKGTPLEYEGQLDADRETCRNILWELGTTDVTRSNHTDRLYHTLLRGAPSLLGLPELNYPKFMGFDELGIRFHNKPYEFLPNWVLVHGDEGSLNRNGGGTAQTFSGQMVVMSEKVEDAKGAIGDALLPLLTEMGTIFDTYIMPIITETTASIGAFFQGISDNGGVMATLEDIRDSIMAFVDGNPIIQRLIDLWNTLSTSIQQIYADATDLASDPAVQNWAKQILAVHNVLAECLRFANGFINERLHASRDFLSDFHGGGLDVIPYATHERADGFPCTCKVASE